MVRAEKIPSLSSLILGLVAGLFGVFFALSLATVLPKRVFLVKSENGYSLVSMTSAGLVETEEFISLEEARERLSENGYRLGSPGRSELTLSDIQLVNGDHKSLLYWRIQATSLLLRLTFSRPSDAEFFRASFAAGGYTPSPHGHAVFFTRD